VSLRDFTSTILLVLFSSLAQASSIKGCPSEISNWGLRPSAESGINICSADGFISHPFKVRVGVVDTGVDPTHHILINHLESNHRIEGGFGWDVSSEDFDPKDYLGHGTHISGIITNVGNSAYGELNPISLLSVKWYSVHEAGDKKVALDRSTEALKYAIAKNVQIINYSAGGTGASKEEFALLKIAEKKGILVVVAAGNDGQLLGNGADDYNYYPAAYRLNNMISVGSVYQDGSLLRSSNFGPKIDMAAPGNQIWSSLPQDKFGFMTGTSQATAFVSGVAALLLSQNPKLKAVDLKAILEASVRKMDRLKGKVRLEGVVDAARALELLQSYTNKPVRKPLRSVAGKLIRKKK
jgi:thermitase